MREGGREGGRLNEEAVEETEVWRRNGVLGS